MNQPGRKWCNLPFYAAVRVRIFHLKTGRRTWKTWYLCKAHYISILECGLEKWTSVNDKGETVGKVIEFNENV